MLVEFEDMKVEVDEEALDDWEVFDMLCRIDEGEIRCLRKVMPRLIGESGFDVVKEHSKVNERVSTKKMLATFFEILKAAGKPAKN